MPTFSEIGIIQYLKDNAEPLSIGGFLVGAIWFTIAMIKQKDKEDYRDKIKDKPYIPHLDELEKTLKADEYFG